jgi:hypothetical protein
MALIDISFDDEDKNLFQVPDARLRAEALQHSILPRLHAVLNESIALAREIYDVEALDDSIISYYPHFRPNRTRELNHLYEDAFCGLGGKRIKDKWLGVERKDGKPVQIVPFRLGFSISKDGLELVFENWGLKGLTKESYRKWFSFHYQHEALIVRLCFALSMFPSVHWNGEDVKFISPLAEHYRFMEKEGLFDNHFISQTFRYPIATEKLEDFAERYALFYPVYDSYICIAKGEPERFLELIAKANDWVKARHEAMEQDEVTENEAEIPDEVTDAALALAEQKVRVMPAIRWQVFQRDLWKCCSCGRGSQQDAILHVDHIIPRSRGGSDTLDNYQTLCS